MTPYAMTKYGMDGFFSTLRQEVKHKNISVTNCILAGVGGSTVDISLDFTFDLVKCVMINRCIAPVIKKKLLNCHLAQPKILQYFHKITKNMFFIYISFRHRVQKWSSREGTKDHEGYLWHL